MWEGGTCATSQVNQLTENFANYEEPCNVCSPEFVILNVAAQEHYAAPNVQGEGGMSWVAHWSENKGRC